MKREAVSKICADFLHGTAISYVNIIFWSPYKLANEKEREQSLKILSSHGYASFWDKILSLTVHLSYV